MTNKIKLSIIIVNWNTKELLKNCLESIFQSEQQTANSEQQFEILVVDNNSSDGSREYLEKNQSSIINHQSLKVIFNDRNLGFAKANNQAIETARGEYIMLLNSDTVVKKNGLKKLVDYLDKHKDTAAVSPQLLNNDGTPQINYYMKFPNFWQIILYHNYPLRQLSMITFLKNFYLGRHKPRPFTVDQLPGAALMIRKRIIEQVGKLDDSFIFFFEDVDWCYRINKQTNKKLVVVPEAKIIHFGGASWKKWRQKDRFKFYRQYYLSLLKFVDKNYRLPKFFYQVGLTFSFWVNFLVHLVTFTRRKAVVNLKLIKTIWLDKYYFQLPQ